MSSPEHFSVSTFTHIGKREENQDRLRVLSSQDQRNILGIVADGMGGHRGGALAAQTTIETIEKLWQAQSQLQNIDQKQAENFLHELVEHSHLAVNAVGEANNMEPRTTLAVLYLFECNEHLFAVSIHAGDSRITQYSATEQITRSFDHSLAQLKVLRGKITEEELIGDPDQSTVISNIGGKDSPEPEITHWDLTKGKRFSLSSDGFWEVFNTNEVLAFFEVDAEQREVNIEQALMVKMEQRPKHDNTTVIMIEID